MTVEKLLQILTGENPGEKLDRRKYEVFKLIPALHVCRGFEQHSIWHKYDVYNHILKVVDNVPNDMDLRLSALFHDIGKPCSFSLDGKGRGHFSGHWLASSQIFLDFAKNNDLPEALTKKVEKLIMYHDINIDKLNDEHLNIFLKLFNKEEIHDLFLLKKADLLAQNEEFNYLLNDYEEQEKMLLGMYKGSDTCENTVFTRSKKKK